jgi:hypothetical protein
MKAMLVKRLIIKKCTHVVRIRNRYAPGFWHWSDAGELQGLATVWDSLRVIEMIVEGVSEYAHPNFLSMHSAFTTDESGRFHFRHGSRLKKSDFQATLYVALSGDVFVHLFDELGKRISDGTIDQVDETNWGKPAA